MSLPASLKKYGLVSAAKSPVRRRLVMTSEAETGCGKSDFMFRSAPRPLLIVDLDQNLEALKEKYPADDVQIHTVVLPKRFNAGSKADKAKHLEIATTIQDLYIDAVESDYFRSVFIDTNNELWELARRAFLDNGGEGFGSDKRTDYAPANSYMKSFFDTAKSKRINFCMSAHVKDEYKGANATGKRVAGGWKGAVQASQCHVRLYKDKAGVTPDKFHAEILKCSYNSDLEGFELTGEEIGFAQLGKLVFPQSEDEDWDSRETD